MNPLVTSLDDHFEMSQAEIARKMFLHVNTVSTTEKRAIEKFKQAMLDRGITLQDLLE